MLFAVVTAGCQSSGTKTALKTQQDSVSYAIGLNIGSNMVKDSLQLDYPALLKGIQDAWLDTSKRMMNFDGVRSCLMAWQQQMQAKQVEKQHAQGEKNRLEGEKFLADNKKEEGVVTLPSGLQYKIITEGKGLSPKANETVVANYAGTLINGQEFDSSVKHGQPAEFPLTNVIAGWTEALQLMKVGSKWKLFIPANLAWGDQGSGEKIPPGSTVIFEVELLAIKPPAK